MCVDSVVPREPCILVSWIEPQLRGLIIKLNPAALQMGKLKFSVRKSASGQGFNIPCSTYRGGKSHGRPAG